MYNFFKSLNKSCLKKNTKPFSIYCSTNNGDGFLDKKWEKIGQAANLDCAILHMISDNNNNPNNKKEYMVHIGDIYIDKAPLIRTYGTIVWQGTASDVIRYITDDYKENENISNQLHK